MSKNILKIISSIILAILLSNCGGGNSIVTNSSITSLSVPIFDSTTLANDE